MRFLSVRRAAWPLAAAALVALATPPLLNARESYAAHCRDVHDLHTRPALDLATQLPPDKVVMVEGAGSSRYHLANPIIDVIGLNHAALAHARKTGPERLCALVLSRPDAMLLPDVWIANAKKAFVTKPIAEYLSPRWSVADGRVGRRVLAAHVEPLPGIEAHCKSRVR